MTRLTVKKIAKLFFFLPPFLIGCFFVMEVGSSFLVFTELPKLGIDAVFFQHLQYTVIRQPLEPLFVGLIYFTPFLWLVSFILYLMSFRGSSTATASSEVDGKKC